MLPLLTSGVHRALGHTPITLPILTITESVAEKLARYARVPLSRDLYDLCWYGRSVLDEPAIRRMWVQKVYGDVIVEERWKRPFNPAAILQPRPAASIDDESIGFLTHPADIVGWEHDFRTRYAFLSDLDEEDLTWASCSARDHYRFEQLHPGPPP